MKLQNNVSRVGFRRADLFSASGADAANFRSLFTFQFLDFLIVFAGGLLLLVGLTLLALKRRGEILRDLLTPEEPDIELEFFKRLAKLNAEKEPVEEEPVEAEPEAVADDEDGWGVTATEREEPPQT